MRRIIFVILKVLVSGILLYLALRKVNFVDLASRLDIQSVGWIALAFASLLASIAAGSLRWRDVSAVCGAPLSFATALRYNLIGAFFNQVLPSSIGGDAVRLWLVGRNAGWKAAAYSVFVDRVIGIVALTIVIAIGLPWSYRLIGDPHGRAALLVIDLSAFAVGGGFLALGLLPWPQRFLPRLRQRWQAASSPIAPMAFTS